jgi:hypothetical protein
MACGCGKKAARPSINKTTVARVGSTTSRVDTAKTYQSATIKSAPTAPVSGTTRKTV